MTGRILVAGAAGRLGASIVDAFAGYEVIAHTRATLDITDPEAVRRVIGDAAPAVIINCAALNDVDGAEECAADALAVNAFGVRSLARAAERCGAAFVHFGTDFVFDGKATEPYDEEAAPSPQSVYALSKLLGEWFALDAPRGFVLRIESVFGAPAGWRGRAGSLDVIVEGLEQGRDVRVFTDRVVSPSYALDVSLAVRHLVEIDVPPGLYHCVNSGHATWYDVAEETARLLGVRPRLQPITLEQVAFKAPRPQFCALANQKLAATGFTMPAWDDALRRWLTGRSAHRDNDKIDRVHG